jgi:hypothetical protein
VSSSKAGALMGNRHRPVSSLLSPACKQAFQRAKLPRQGKARKHLHSNSKSSPTSIKSRRKKERTTWPSSCPCPCPCPLCPLHTDRDRTNTSPSRKHPSKPFSHNPFLPYHSEVDVIANKAGQLQSSIANPAFPPSLSCLKAIFLPLFELHHPTTVNSRSSYLESTSKAPRKHREPPNSTQICTLVSNVYRLRILHTHPSRCHR